MENNKLLADLQRLKQMRQANPTLEAVIALHASIVTDSNRIRHWAAAKTKKVFSGKYAWSPEWQQAKAPVLLWKMVLKRLKGGTVKSKFLKRLMKQCQEPKALHLTMAEAQNKLDRAHNHFNAASMPPIG